MVGDCLCNDCYLEKERSYMENDIANHGKNASGALGNSPIVMFLGARVRANLPVAIVRPMAAAAVPSQQSSSSQSQPVSSGQSQPSSSGLSQPLSSGQSQPSSSSQSQPVSSGQSQPSSSGLSQPLSSGQSQPSSSGQSNSSSSGQSHSSSSGQGISLPEADVSNLGLPQVRPNRLHSTPWYLDDISTETSDSSDDGFDTSDELPLQEIAMVRRGPVTRSTSARLKARLQSTRR